MRVQARYQGGGDICQVHRRKWASPTLLPLRRLGSSMAGDSRTESSTTASNDPMPAPLPEHSPGPRLHADHADLMATALHDKEKFIEMTLKGRLGPDMPWRRLSIRPVLIRNRRKLQFSYFSEKQNIVTNHADAAALEELDSLLRLPWSSVAIRNKGHEDLCIQLSRKGKLIVHHSPTPAPHPASSPSSLKTDDDPGVREPLASSSLRRPVWLQHDRAKQLPIPPSHPHPFLQRLGMQLPDGRIRSDMQDKFTQINEFLKLLGHTGALEHLRPKIMHLEGRRPSPKGPQDAMPVPAEGTAPLPASLVSGRALLELQGEGDSSTSPEASTPRVCILDCGCGSSHLTFGTFHYLEHVLELPARIMGVDSNGALMKRSNEYSRQLGMSQAQAQFFESPILKFKAPVPADVVLALHACDTATDEALAVGVKQGAVIIMAVPCCHKHLHHQMAGRPGPGAFSPVMRHGILRQRQIDLLTDAFRAQLLQILGYKTDVVEFISAEHTPRNLLLRAVKSRHKPALSSPQIRGLLDEYDQMKAAWGCLPHLETLLLDELSAVRKAVDQHAAQTV